MGEPLSELATAAYVDRRNLAKWVRSGRLQANQWGWINHHNGWLTTLGSVQDAIENEWTPEQREANGVANDLIRDFGLERVTEWE